MTGDVDETLRRVFARGSAVRVADRHCPFDAASMRQAGLAEMLRIMREEEAPPLSRKLTTMGAAAADMAARRQTDAASLRRLVDGDLNWIAMKALEKVRERRYASVAELAADIQRHMEHRAVLASPPGDCTERASFFAGTGRSLFGAAAGLAFIALGGVTAWSLAAPRLSAETQIDRQSTQSFSGISRMPQAIRPSMERCAR